MNKLCTGEPLLWLDQYGRSVVASTVKELAREAGGGRVSKMYIDTKDGRTLQTGYVVGARWFSAFKPRTVEATD